MKTIAAPKKTGKAAALRVPLVVTADGAKQVALIGDFTHWEKEGIPMSRDGNGTWRTVLQLAPGEYQYRLLVDGQWRDDPDAAKRVPNAFGTENCVLVVV